MKRRTFLHHGAVLGLAPLALTACSSGASPDAYEALAIGNLFSAGLSRDGRLALIGSIEHGGSLWDLANNARLFDWNHQQGQYSNIIASDFSPDGRFAVTATPNDMVLWNTGSGASEGFWSAPAEILDISLSDQGRMALIGCANNKALYFDIRNGGIERELSHQARVRAVAINSRDPAIGVSGADDYTSHSWDLGSGKELASITLENVIDCVAINDDASLAFSAATLDKAIIWNPQTGEIQHDLSARGLFSRPLSYISATFSEDGSQLLLGTTSGLVELWNANSGQLQKRWQLHQSGAYGPNTAATLATGFAGTRLQAVGSNGVFNQFS